VKSFKMNGTEISLDVLMDGGALCVAGVWNDETKMRAHGLYRIYVPRLGVTFGPYYALIGAAHHAMRKTLEHFPRGFFDGQGLDWYRRQTAFHDWVEKNLGKHGSLVGAEWARD